MATANSPGKIKQQLPTDFQFPDEADHYEVLGVSDAATATEIKKAYRLRCLEHHPDKHPERTYCKENFQRVGAAYDALSNEDLRKQYDHQRWSADMGVNVTSQQVQRFCMQHRGKRLDYVDMEPWVDQEVLRRIGALQSSMSRDSGFMFLPCPTPGGQAGAYLASTSLEEIARVKDLIQRILSEFRGDTATADGVTILLPPDLKRGPGALQQLQQNFQLIQVQTQVRMNTHMSDRVVLWGPIGGSRSQVDAVCRVQSVLQWRGVMLVWDVEADNNSKGGSRGKQVSPWDYLASIEVACSASLTPGKLPPPGKAEPAFEEVPSLIRRLLPEEAVQGCPVAKNVDDDLLELLQQATSWLKVMQRHAGPVLSRMLGVARSVQDRRKRAEEAQEARKRLEAEQKKRALQEAKARAMGLADQMLQQEAKEGNKDAIRILAEDFMRQQEEEDRKRKEEQARIKAEKELARKMAEEAHQKALEEANRRFQEIRERKRRAEELARKRIAEEVERRKAEEEAKQKAQKAASSPTIVPPQSASNFPSYSHSSYPPKAPQDGRSHASSTCPVDPPGVNVQSGRGPAPSFCPQDPPGLNVRSGKGHASSATPGTSESKMPGDFRAAPSWYSSEPPGLNSPKATGSSRTPFPKAFPKGVPAAAGFYKPQESGTAQTPASSPRVVGPRSAKWSHDQKPQSPHQAPPPSPQKQEEDAEAKRKALEEAEAKRKAQEEVEAKRKAQEEVEAKRKAEEEKKRKAMQEVEDVMKKRQKLEEINKKALAEMKKRLLEEADDALRESKIKQTY